MTVISVSLTDKNLEDLDKLQKILGLAGRSEAIRVCLRSAESEIRDRDSMEGDVEGILIVVHHADNGGDLDSSVHMFQKIILTQVHSHLKSGKCLDVFLVSGKAVTAKEMLTSFQKNESIEYVKFVRS